MSRSTEVHPRRAGFPPWRSTADRPPRRSVRETAGSGTRAAVAAVAAAESAVIRLVIRLVMAAASLIAALIGLAIVLRLLGANSHNGVAHDIHVAANFFAGSFTTLFTIHHARLSILVNWGVALCVYLLAGMIVAAVIAWIGRAIIPRRIARAE